VRTTLDIDDDILQAAKELAKAERKTTGQVLSDLARKGLTQPPSKIASPVEEADFPYVLKDGWYVLPSRGVVTNAMIDRIQEELELGGAGKKGLEKLSAAGLHFFH
jgi:hypothetical protein